MKKSAYLSNLIHHFLTISKHKYLVGKYCFKCGMYKQGLLHDNSKYSPIEFFSGVKYYQGFRSPIDEEKKQLGYSKGWLHHKGRNKHHFEYWVDKDYVDIKYKQVKMPFNYLLESVVDRIVASKVYNKENYNDSYPLNFFLNGKEQYFMNEDNKKQLIKLLKYLNDNGEKKALQYYRELYRNFKRNKTEI